MKYHNTLRCDCVCRSKYVNCKFINLTQKPMKNLKTNWFIKHTLTVFSCVLIVVLGIAFLSQADPVTTTIGENIATNDLSVTMLTVNGDTITTGNLDVSGNTLLATTILNGDLTVDADTFYVDSTNNRIGIGTDSPEVKLDINGNIKIDNIVLSGIGSNNIVVNSEVNTIEIGTNTNIISGGGRSIAPNLIGTTGLPYYNDFTPTDWSADTGYILESASVATISGGYDNIVNQQAGIVAGGGHNFIKYNISGHSIIGGGSYNLISVGRSGIFSGRRNTITGSGIFSFIGGGDNNNIVDGGYSVIPGGLNNNINGNYSFAFGRRIQINGSGIVALSDETDADFSIGTDNVFGARFSGGYWFTGGNVGIGTINPSGKLHVNTNGDAAALVVNDNIGYVGVGIELPEAKLHIKTNESNEGISLLVLDNSGTSGNEAGMEFWGVPTNNVGGLKTGRIYGTWDGGSYTDARLSFQSMTTGNTPVDTMHLKNGNVGIGDITPTTKLDVNGIIKTAPRSTATCNSTIEGGIYYDSDDNHFYGCNGTSWIRLDYNP